MAWHKFVLNLDRRIIYTIVALCVITPLLRPLALPVVPTPEVKGVFDRIDELPEGSRVIIAADFDAASKPELLPMLDAAVAHCFIKKLQPTVVTLWPAGLRLLQSSVERQAKRFGKISGTDYAWLGYRPGNALVVVGLAGSITGTYGTDYYGKPTPPMPVFQGVNKLADYDYILDIAAGQTVEPWITYGSKPANVPMGASCTAVSVASYYAFYQARQVTGLAGGMKGSAEYEQLLNDKYGAANPPGFSGDATKGMDAQSIVHLFIVLSIIVANIAFFQSRKAQAAARRAT